MRLSFKQKAVLYGEMSKMLRAGFGVERAAGTLIQQKCPAPQRAYAEALKSGLGKGLRISEAVRQVDLGLTPLETAMVEAGEKGGKLDAVYEHLSAHFWMLARTSDRVRAQLVYPLILLHLGVILPAIPQAILAGDRMVFVKSVALGFGILYGAGLLTWVVSRRLARAARESVAVDAALRRIPLAGKARQQLALARFCNVFHILLLSAHSISEAVRAAGEASQSGVLRQTGRRLAERIREGGGDSFRDMLVTAAGFPPELARSLATAAETGSLDEELGRWSAYYREGAVDALQAAGIWLVRLLYFGVMAFVVWQILGLAQGYFDTLEGFLEMGVAPIFLAHRGARRAKWRGRIEGAAGGKDILDI